MQAMILAAGRGTRMRPLTNHIPKPLLSVAGKPLLVHHLENLAAAGIRNVVINTAYLGHCIHEAIGDGSTWGVQVQYADEQTPLETGGAIANALPLLDNAPFLLLNGDVWCDAPLPLLMQQPLGEAVAHLLFVNNPAHHLQGDFSLDKGIITHKKSGQTSYTFSGIAKIHPQLIQDYPKLRAIFPLREVFDHYIHQGKLHGSIHNGQWCDVGTPERLEALNHQLGSVDVS